MENEQYVVGIAQYDSVRIEYADRIDEQAERHREEIKRQQELFIGMQNSIIETKEKDIKSWKIACIVSMTSLFLVIVGLIGGALYLFNNFDFDVSDYSYSQENTGINNIGDNNNYGADIKD